MLGLFGSALLYGDGVITPAISVLGAVEGLRVAAPLLPDWGRAGHLRRDPGRRSSSCSGGARRGWARCSAESCSSGSSRSRVLGIGGIVRHPSVLRAVNPW